MATLVALSKQAEARDEDTGKHNERTQVYCKMLAYESGKVPAFAGIINMQFVEDMYYASPMHDIGKVTIPDAILLKPGKLTPDEFEVMKTHAEKGAKTLETVQIQYPDNDFVSLGIDISRFHHEKWNGKGYPQGRAENDIPLSARIMSLADVYDALTSVRCYKKAFSHEDSCNIIAEERGVSFDPELVGIFLKSEADFNQVRRTLR